MRGAPALPDAVSVRYAREQFAMGYIHGRADVGADRLDPLSFARFYADRCEFADGPVDVHSSYAHWVSSHAEPR